MTIEEIAKLIPGYDPWRNADGWVFDPVRAQLALDFFAEMLTFADGPKAGEAFCLERWQQAIVANLYGWWDGDKRRYKEAFVFVPRKNGKMLALDTPLPTPAGWTTMGEVQVGDTLFDERGQPCRVVNISSIDLAPESYRLEFSNGESVRACADHQWLTTARVDAVGAGVGARAHAGEWNERRTTRVRSTREIYETQTYGKRGDRNHSLEMPQPLETRDADLPVDPYWLGAWLGDGESDGARLTCSSKDTFIVNELERRGLEIRQQREQAGKTPRFGIGSRRQLRQLGVLGNKHIPAEYLRASRRQRLELLQGLMDTDGTVSSNGRILEISTVKLELAHGIGELLATLGIKFSRRETIARCNGRVLEHSVYRFQFVAFRDELEVFRLPRKLERMRRRADCSSSPRSRTVQISRVERIDPTPMRCITVDSPSRLYLFGRTMLPTHNTPLAAGLLLHEMYCYPTVGGQYYSAAADREQAALIYRDAAAMIRNEPELSVEYKMTPSAKVIQKLKGDPQFYKALSSDAGTKHGLRPCFVIVDELHAHPNAELVDTLTTGTAVKGMQPLVIYITTADYNRESVCNTKYKYAVGVRDGKVDDLAFLPVIYEASREADWTDPEVWKAANPNYGISVSEDYLARECERAKVEPSYENTFKRLHLNIQTESVERWLRLDLWDQCAEPFDPAMLKGQDCFAGLDLSSTQDITAFVLYFPDGGYVLPFMWIPGESAELRQKNDGVPYTAWVNADPPLLEETEGNFIDHDVIFNRIVELSNTYNIRNIAFDGWQAAAMYTRLTTAGLTAEKHGQGMAAMNSPAKRLESLIGRREIRHGGNPVLRWMATNVVKQQDNDGHIRPSKGKSSEKIDGIVALIMAIGAADVADEVDWYVPGGLAV